MGNRSIICEIVEWRVSRLVLVKSEKTCYFLSTSWRLEQWKCKGRLAVCIWKETAEV